MTDTSSRNGILQFTAQIVAAHVSRNAVSADALPALVRSVHSTLSTIEVAEAVPAPLIPVVPVKRSIQGDHLVCLEDGVKLKMLKRYLASRYGLTPDQYRAKWGLPSNYPMVAPDYAKHRSALSKQFGLGRKPKAAAVEQEAAAEEPDEAPAQAALPLTAASVFANFPSADQEAADQDDHGQEALSMEADGQLAVHGDNAAAPPRAKRKRFAEIVVRKMPKRGGPSR